MSLVALVVPGHVALLIALFTPLVAVLFRLLVVTRDGYTRAGWQALGLHRLGLSGWGWALLTPPLILLLSYSGVWSMGLATVRVPVHPDPVAQGVDLLASIVIVTFLATGEEIGWRGYLLPRLVPLGPRRAALLTGLMHGVWHLPVLVLLSLYHSTGTAWIIIPLFLLTLTAGGAFYGYLRFSTGSVWPVALAHSTFNVFWDLFNTLTTTQAPVATEYLAGESGLLTLLGTAVVALWLLYRLGGQHPKIAV